MVVLRSSIAWLALLPLVWAGDVVLDLQNEGRSQVNAMVAKSKTCTKEKLQIRREW